MKQLDRKAFLMEWHRLQPGDEHKLEWPGYEDNTKQLTQALQNYPDAVALVRFVNLDLSSSHCGDQQALVVGPSNMFKSIEDCEGRWLNDLPSQRQYAQDYVTREDFLDAT